ncbi:hypothetical protein HC864_04840 [Candidatus Gracilibacteria bacterium]|nr:hypothetical protein [Candidatus Gracilibacteria bacterium]
MGVANIVVRQFAKEIPRITTGLVAFTQDLSKNQKLEKTLESIGVPTQASEVATEYLNNQTTQLTSILGVDSGEQTLNRETIQNILNWGTGAASVFANQLVYVIIFCLLGIRETSTAPNGSKNFLN